MFIDLPAQGGDVDPDAIFSRFEERTSPPNVTTWEDSSVDVVFQAAASPTAFTSTNPKVAGANLAPRAIFSNLESNHWPVEIHGRSPGIATITAINQKGQPIWGHSLEVLVLRRQEVHANFYFVTDWLGTTQRQEAQITSILLPVCRSIFAPANITFTLHQTRKATIPVRLDDTVTTLAEFNKRRDAIVRLGQQMDPSTRHLQIFLVPIFRLLDAVRPGVNVHGHTRGRNIILEDIGTEVELAHEIGHALGLEHNTQSGALMTENAAGTLLIRDDILKIGMLR